MKHEVQSRAGRVRELTRPSHSKFKMIWHQFGTVQFPSHQFVWKVRPVQCGAREPSASVQFNSSSSFHELFWPWFRLTWLARFGSGSVQPIEFPIIRRKQRSSSRSPPAEIPALRPGVCRLGAGIVRFAVCACFLVRGVGVTQIQFKIF